MSRQSIEIYNCLLLSSSSMSIRSTACIALADYNSNIPWSLSVLCCSTLRWHHWLPTGQAWSILLTLTSCAVVECKRCGSSQQCSDWWGIMILDGEQVLEGISKGFVKYPGEEHSAWLLRLSHLHCQNQVSWERELCRGLVTVRVQGITKISDLTSCANLTVLYLYNNKLRSIEVRHPVLWSPLYFSLIST